MATASKANALVLSGTTVSDIDQVGTFNCLGNPECRVLVQLLLEQQFEEVTEPPHLQQADVRVLVSFPTDPHCQDWGTSCVLHVQSLYQGYHRTTSPGKLSRSLQDPSEGVELVHCSIGRTKATLLPLSAGVYYPKDQRWATQARGPDVAQ